MRLLIEIYETAEERVKIDTDGPNFKVKKGVKHGGLLSLNLFGNILEKLFC